MNRLYKFQSYDKTDSHFVKSTISKVPIKARPKSLFESDESTTRSPLTSTVKSTWSFLASDFEDIMNIMITSREKINFFIVSCKDNNSLNLQVLLQFF